MKIRNAIKMGALILAAGGAVVLGTLGGDVEPVADGGTVEPVAVSSIRAVRLDGACPAAAKGAPECQSAIQLNGKCLCLTDQKAGEVDAEVTAEAEALKPAKDRQRLVVCERDIIDPKTGLPTGKKQIRSEWQSEDKLLPAECREVCASVVLPNVSMTSIESGIEDCLRTACSPCPISSGSWGRCPNCLLEPGGCEAACPEVEDDGL